MRSFVLFLLVTQSVFASNELHLSLKAYIRMYLRDSADVRISGLDIEIAQSDYISSKGEFDLSLTYNFSHDFQNTPVSSSLDTTGDASSVKVKTTTSTFSLSKFFSSGTTLTLPFELNKIDSDSTYRIFPVTYEPSVSLQLNQPIIQTLFSGYHSKKKTIAKKKWEEINVRERDNIENLVFKQIEKYFKILEIEKSLNIVKKSLETSTRNLEFIKHKRKLGKSSLLDLMESTPAYNKSKERLLREEIRYFENYKRLSNEVSSSMNIILQTNIENFYSKNINALPSKKKMYEIALLKRGDLLSLKYKVDIQKLKKKFASVDKLPRLEVDGNFTSNAISTAQQDATADLFEFKFKTWSAGITLSHYLNGNAARGSYVQNSLKLKKEKLKLGQMKNDLSLEIDISIRNYKTQRQVANSLRRSMFMEEKKIQFYQRQYRQGTLSSFDLATHLDTKDKTELEYHKAEFKLESDYYNILKVQGILTEKFINI